MPDIYNNNFPKTSGKGLTRSEQFSKEKEERAKKEAAIRMQKPLSYDEVIKKDKDARFKQGSDDKINKEIPSFDYSKPYKYEDATPEERRSFYNEWNSGVSKGNKTGGFKLPESIPAKYKRLMGR